MARVSSQCRFDLSEDRWGRSRASDRSRSTEGITHRRCATPISTEYHGHLGTPTAKRRPRPPTGGRTRCGAVSTRISIEIEVMRVLIDFFPGDRSPVRSADSCSACAVTIVHFSSLYRACCVLRSTACRLGAICRFPPSRGRALDPRECRKLHYLLLEAPPLFSEVSNSLTHLAKRGYVLSPLVSRAFGRHLCSGTPRNDSARGAVTAAACSRSPALLLISVRDPKIGDWTLGNPNPPTSALHNPRRGSQQTRSLVFARRLPRFTDQF